MTRRRAGIAALLALTALAALVASQRPAPTPPDPATARRQVAADAREAARPRIRVLRRGGPVPAAPVPEPTPVAAPELVTVRCPLPPDVAATHPTGAVTVDLHDGARTVPARVEGRALSFESPRDAPGTAVVHLHGFSPASLAYGPGSCTVDPLVGRATISGVVVAAHGVDDDRITVSGCGAATRVDVDGGFFLEVDAAPCTLWATRQDGAFALRSEPLFLDPRPLEDVVVELSLPPWRAAGVGLSLRQDDVSVYVRAVLPGSPAEAAGLRRGDRIVGLDGEDVLGVDLYDVVDLALGPAGSEVEYTVEREDGEVVPILMVRQLID